jgi:lysophospholipase L1-like esterase
MAMTLIGPLVLALILVFDTPREVWGEMKMDNEKAGSKIIVVIGASYAGGWDPGRPIAGYRMVTKGVSGEQSSQVLARFETDAIALKPDAVIIWGFINDVFRSDPARIDQTLVRTRESLLAMVESARKAGTVPILATEVTVRGADRWSEKIATLIGRILGKSSYQDYINQHVTETNRWIRELATREGILLLDLEAVLADRDGIRRKEFAKPDGSHISPKGYEALTRYTEDRLKTSFGAR